MILDRFSDLLLTADPDCTRYGGNRKGNYTVWREYGRNTLPADNHSADRAMKVQVDRFTKLEDDPVAKAITSLLDSRDEVAFQYMVDYEPDTGYIHHIWDCEVL